MRLDVRFDPPLRDEYLPLERHTVTIEMIGEHLGLGADVNENIFVAEAIDDAGRPAGFSRRSSSAACSASGST